MAVALAQPLSVSACPYTQEDLEAARHLNDRPVRELATWNLDLVQRSVGGDNSWGAQPLPPYRPPCRPYDYEFLLRPVCGGETDLDELSRSPQPQSVGGSACREAHACDLARRRGASGSPDSRPRSRLEPRPWLTGASTLDHSPVPDSLLIRPQPI